MGQGLKGAGSRAVMAFPMRTGPAKWTAGRARLRLRKISVYSESLSYSNLCLIIMAVASSQKPSECRVSLEVSLALFVPRASTRSSGPPGSACPFLRRPAGNGAEISTAEHSRKPARDQGSGGKQGEWSRPGWVLLPHSEYHAESPLLRF